MECRNRANSFLCALLVFSCGAERPSMPLAPPKPHAVAPWPAAKTIYKVGGDVTRPVPVSRTEPKIPIGAPCRGLVMMQCVIDEKGNVMQVRDITSQDRKSTRLNSSHSDLSRMPSSA